MKINMNYNYTITYIQKTSSAFISSRSQDPKSLSKTAICNFLKNNMKPGHYIILFIHLGDRRKSGNREENFV